MKGCLYILLLTKCRTTNNLVNLYPTQIFTIYIDYSSDDCCMQRSLFTNKDLRF